jgi:tRNA(Ile)-lysidine synthase
MAPFEPFETSPVLAVAVSGGRDSLALALLTQEWTAVRGGCVVGLIVDHGLRAGSAEEAVVTRGTLARHGIEGTILSWTGAKPPTGLQERAREARYRLLGDECRRRGILHLLLAHHAGDQAETVAMRAARRSGPDGLAGMAALSERADLRLLRPLLAVPRVRLTATLVARGVQWLEDPSNTDLRFERARMRLGAPLGEPPMDAGERSVRERRLAHAAVDVIEFDQEGMAAIDRTRLAALAADLQAGLLGRLVQSLGGRDHPPRRDRLQRAVRRLGGSDRRGKSGKARDFTLSGCRLMLRQAPESRRLRWIVRAERGRNMSQPFIPAAFFACGAPGAYHLE